MKKHRNYIGFKTFLRLTPLVGIILGNSILAGEMSRPSYCINIGRVLISWDSGIPHNSIICKDSEIIVGQGLKVFVACNKKKLARWLKEGEYNSNDLCLLERFPRKQCLLIENESCWRNAQKLQILFPRSFSMISTSFEMKWKPEQLANKYEVIVMNSNGIVFSSSSYVPRFQFTENMLSLGEMYEIKIIALNEEKVIIENRIFLNFLSEPHIKEIQEAIHSKEVNSLPLQERAQIVDSIYMSWGLDHLAIQYLNQVLAQEDVPTVAQLLGDRYLKIGEIDQAINNYERVIRSSKESSEEYKHASEMLGFAKQKISY